MPDRRYHYYTVDVFAERPFEGNPLAVVVDARGLDTSTMQAVAAEFNYAESTFILPPRDAAHTAQVRIFTPREEVPFAGHPNVGTGFLLGTLGTCLGRPLGTTLTFEEHAGVVPVELVIENGATVGATLTAPEPLTLGATPPVDVVAAAVFLDAPDIITQRHAPVVASVGLPFLMVELASRDGLRRARPNVAALGALLHDTKATGIHLYTRATDRSADIYCRMFAPEAGVFEDPATGSANAALTALLATRDTVPGALSLRIAQGIEMGRPSLLLTEVRDARVRVSGRCALVMQGTLTL